MRQLLRWFVDWSTQFLGKMRRHQRLAIAGDIKANLGCGLTVAHGWYNVDGSPNAVLAGLPQFFQRLGYRLTGARVNFTKEDYLSILRGHRFVHHDLAWGVPFRDKSVDYFYSQHFLEHLERDKALRLLSDCFRALKPGGRIRIGVPDLEHAINLYQNGQKERMLDLFFGGEGAGHFARHKYMYDFELMKSTLEGLGFRQVKRMNFRQGGVPDLDVLDNREEYTLFVEAVKPTA